MAVVIFVSTKKGRSSRSLKYISQDYKTDKQKYVTALNCSLIGAEAEFKNTRIRYRKNNGVLFHHFIQSHPSGYDIDPALSHKIAIEFAQKAFKGFECVVATHIEKDHIHNHIVFNSVNAETGMKYNSCKATLKRDREISDEICMKYGVPVLDSPELSKKTYGITREEYRCAMQGNSWKIHLINMIDDTMEIARSKEGFCTLMNLHGYDVLWEDDLKYITYTCPNGYKCRDNKLHDERYRKEKMEYEFNIRRNESSLKPESERSREYSNGVHSESMLGYTDFTAQIPFGDSCFVESQNGYDHDFRSDEYISAGREENARSGRRTGTCNTEGDCKNDGLRISESEFCSDGPVITGWENERAILIESAKNNRDYFFRTVQLEQQDFSTAEQSIPEIQFNLENCERIDTREDIRSDQGDEFRTECNLQTESKEHKVFSICNNNSGDCQSDNFSIYGFVLDSLNKQQTNKADQTASHLLSQKPFEGKKIKKSSLTR